MQSRGLSNEYERDICKDRLNMEIGQHGTQLKAFTEVICHKENGIKH